MPDGTARHKTIFEVLREDHDVQRRLVDLLGKTKGASDGRKELFNRLRKETMGHAAAEERTLYAEMLKHEMTREKGAHSVKEHQELDAHFSKLEEMGFDNPNFLRAFEKLEHDLIHHLDEEEQEVFQLAGRQLDEATKLSLGGDFLKLKPVEVKNES